MTSPKPATKAVASSDPVEPFNSALARSISHLHPLLILIAYRYQFNALIQDPVRQLLNSLPLLAILQAIYMGACFPPAWMNRPAPSNNDSKCNSQRSKERSSQEQISIPKVVVSALLSVVIALLLATPIITIFMVLLGAPLTTHLPHTALASAHFSLLAVMPLVYICGVDGNKWEEIIAVLRPLDEVFGATLGTFIGAWLGAIPIPLDWDRDWQKWPVTIVTGAYVGYVLGKYLGQYPLRGKSVEFD
ncbi:MAG: Glycosylphosphatidylinositol (GPI) anchor assembly protein [Peltula sp. TS41687]|nr:MAG: Glycosylphosphatidylinositol (GPI) anchor assembly protein [Peltula sp. TS41687]